jgi:hypothetical protein
MALSSTRFGSITTLHSVDQNRAVIEVGSSGRAVHLVQTASRHLNIPGIVGFGEACRIAKLEMVEQCAHRGNA